MACKVTIDSIASDGTNLFVEMRISDGTTTFPTIRPVFPADTGAGTIQSYASNIASNLPTLPASIAALVGTSYSS